MTWCIETTTTGPEWASASDLRQTFGLSPRVLRRLASEGAIRRRKLGRARHARVLYSIASVRQYMEAASCKPVMLPSEATQSAAVRQAADAPRLSPEDRRHDSMLSALGAIETAMNRHHAALMDHLARQEARTRQIVDDLRDIRLNQRDDAR